MKIICIGRNYAEHAAELNNEKPTKPIVFLKPDTSFLKNNSPFYHPAFSSNIHYECELVVRICREGKHIEPKFAHKYYDQIGLGIDFTARDLQEELRTKGLPWELSKGFDHSAVVSHFIPKENLPDLASIHFSFSQNGVQKQVGKSSDMIFGVDELIAFISKFITLKTGDLIFTGTPSGVGKVEIGDLLEGYLEGEKMFECEVR